MSKVLFTFNTGRQALAFPRDAELLRRLGKGDYATRDMADKPKIVKSENAKVAGEQIAQIDPVIQPDNAVDLPVVYDLDKLDADALHALAKERGVKVHHLAGAEKLRKALRSAE